MRDHRRIRTRSCFRSATRLRIEISACKPGSHGHSVAHSAGWNDWCQAVEHWLAQPVSAALVRAQLPRFDAQLQQIRRPDWKARSGCWRASCAISCSLPCCCCSSQLAAVSTTSFYTCGTATAECYFVYRVFSAKSGKCGTSELRPSLGDGNAVRVDRTRPARTICQGGTWCEHVVAAYPTHRLIIRRAFIDVFFTCAVALQPSEVSMKARMRLFKGALNIAAVRILCYVPA